MASTTIAVPLTSRHPIVRFFEAGLTRARDGAVQIASSADDDACKLRHLDPNLSEIFEWLNPG
jgi:hypothetical protein